MTIIEAINRLDSLKPNNYSQDEKVAWLSKLDGIIKEKVIDTHEDGEDIVFDGYDANTNTATEMLVPAPYDDIYVRWLEAQVDYANGEYGKYNNSITMYNSAYAEYAGYYNRKHMPKGAKLKYF